MAVAVVIQQRVRMLREGLTHLLAKDPTLEIVGSATSDEALLRLCVERQPDLAIIEIDATEWDPCQLAVRLQRVTPGLRFLGTHADSYDSARLERAKAISLSHLVPHSVGSSGIAAGILEALACPAPQLGVVDVAVARTSRLTQRETAILRLIAEGCTCLEVALRLGISGKTVENHKQRIFRKLDVQNQSHAIAIALRTGVIDTIHRSEITDVTTANPNPPLRGRPSIDVLVAEANALERDIIMSVCKEKGINVVAGPGNGAELIEVCHRLLPRIVVAPDRFGSQQIDEFLPEILRLGIRLIVTSSAEPSHERLTALLSYGIHGYMSHEATPGEVAIGIQAVARGAVSIDHTAAAIVLQQWRGFRTRLDSRLDLGLGSLTSREEDVLRAMTKGLATKAIARELGVAVKTVENHKIRVFAKMAVRTQAQAVTVALNYGLCEDEHEGARAG
jgi:two-component system nitrate/nitrite response regulator NarL